MKYTRTNVYDHGGTFDNPTLLWYARGVQAMQARKLDDPTSWRFLAAIHGIDQDRWTRYGYLSGTDTMPSDAVKNTYWDQCQHGSWYFLPWHRGYLLALEAMVRDAIIKLGGPEDWALPYWNYFAPGENKLPPAFASPTWKNGTEPNPLYVPQRWGPNNDRDVYVELTRVDLLALLDPDFTGRADGGDTGFGGVETGFSHRSSPHGRLESQPHDVVHVQVGGANPDVPKSERPRNTGVMSYPPTAGLDPIFYLHHANIDRLWEVWLKERLSKGNPTDSKWTDWGKGTGQRPFAMPLPTGKEWKYTPGDMGNLATLDYVYDDLSPRSVSPAFAERLNTLRAAAAAAGVPKGARDMAERDRNVEMVGSSDRPVRIAGAGAIRAPVRVDPPASRRLKANLTAAAGAAPTLSPERVFLNLENVTGLMDAVAFQVYVNVPEGADPADHEDRLAGSVGLFGVTQATAGDGEHGGAGLTFVLEITHLVQALHLENALDGNALEVRIVPMNDVPEEAEISIGRVTVFRQGR